MSFVPADFDFSQIPVPDRITLISRIWDTLVDQDQAPEPTSEQRAELERRIDAHDQNPEDTVPWEDIRAELRQRRNDSTD